MGTGEPRPPGRQAILVVDALHQIHPEEGGRAPAQVRPMQNGLGDHQAHNHRPWGNRSISATSTSLRSPEGAAGDSRREEVHGGPFPESFVAGGVTDQQRHLAGPQGHFVGTEHHTSCQTSRPQGAAAQGEPPRQGSTSLHSAVRQSLQSVGRPHRWCRPTLAGEVATTRGSVGVQVRLAHFRHSDGPRGPTARRMPQGDDKVNRRLDELLISRGGGGWPSRDDSW